jgi:2,3-bisphosphoglycerate-independent phosphoglycerate mutase
MLMGIQELLGKCRKVNTNRILLIVIDGLGGLPHPGFGDKSELESANLPNLDAFVRRRETILGMIDPVARGITPGSAAGHFGLFGYDPLDPVNHIGRGALEAIDLDIPLKSGDLVARINVATLKDGKVVDRRAGRASSAPLLKKVREHIELPGATAEFIATKEHRGVIWIKDALEALDPHISDTDPGENGKPIAESLPLDCENPAARRAAALINHISGRMVDILKDDQPGNCVLMRGFSTRPGIFPMSEIHGLKCLAVADYPLYRGIARLLGMTLVEPVVPLKEKLSQIRKGFDEGYTFVFLHYKTPDSKGEDSDYPGKVKALEAFDEVFPELFEIINPETDVIALTGDHSTPSLVGAHSFHAVPLAVFSAKNRRIGDATEFNEKACLSGTFGRIRGVELMASLLARAGKLNKFDL